MDVKETGRPWSRVDQVMLAVVRLVQDDHWSVVSAAAQLREQGHDEAALALARARVSAARHERPGVFGDRALALLDAALGHKVDDNGDWPLV